MKNTILCAEIILGLALWGYAVVPAFADHRIDPDSVSRQWRTKSQNDAEGIVRLPARGFLAKVPMGFQFCTKALLDGASTSAVEIRGDRIPTQFISRPDNGCQRISWIKIDDPGSTTLSIETSDGDRFTFELNVQSTLHYPDYAFSVLRTDHHRLITLTRPLHSSQNRSLICTNGEALVGIHSRPFGSDDQDWQPVGFSQVSPICFWSEKFPWDGNYWENRFRLSSGEDVTSIIR